MKKCLVVTVTAILFLLIGIFLQWKFNLLVNIKGANFIIFPQTRLAETGSYSDYDLDSSQFANLLRFKSVNTGKKIYKLISTQNLEDTVQGYRIEVDDPTKQGEQDVFPLASGLIIYNQISGKAIQFYGGFVWLNEFNGYQYGLSNTSYVRDVNNDGLNEFDVLISDGGNGFVTPNYILQITSDGGFKLLNPDLSSNQHEAVGSIQDLKDDGKYELIIEDNDWEISSCTDHSSGPLIDHVYSWDSQKGYVDNSINYPEYYQQIIDTDISKQCSGTKDFCFGPALNQYFAYKQMGREKEGWTKFLQLTDGVVNSSWPSKTCRDYVISQHNQNKEITNPGQSIKI